MTEAVSARLAWQGRGRPRRAVPGAERAADGSRSGAGRAGPQRARWIVPRAACRSGASCR